MRRILLLELVEEGPLELEVPDDITDISRRSASKAKLKDLPPRCDIFHYKIINIFNILPRWSLRMFQSTANLASLAPLPKGESVSPTLSRREKSPEFRKSIEQPSSDSTYYYLHYYVC